MVTLLSDSSPPGFDPVVHAETTRLNAGGSAVPAKLLHGLPDQSPAKTNGKERKKNKKKIRRRNTDRRNEYSAVPTGPAAPANGRRTSIGVPPRFSSLFHRKGLSTRLLL